MIDPHQHPAVVARALLGAMLRSQSAHGPVSVRITETEGYAGPDDPASHAYRGATARNRVMFGPGDHLYVYRSHGLHWCCNVVCGQEGQAAAVLLRAGQVMEGLGLARERRGKKVLDNKLASGPGNLAQALGITGDDDGSDLADGSRIALLLRTSLSDAEIATGPRVGVTLAPDVPRRFWIAGDPTVTPYRRSPRAQRT